MNRDAPQAGNSASVLSKALSTIERLERKLDELTYSQNEPIAIIGAGCRFPGGVDSPEDFWRLLRDGVSTVQDVPADRFDMAELYDTDPAAPGKMYMRRGCFLQQVDGFDAAFFKISRREAVQMDPQQRLFLEVCWEALENAGIGRDKIAGTQTGVFAGVLTTDYAHIPGELSDRVDAYYYPGTNSSFIAGRVSYFLDLHGPSMTLDTACSSSLVAVHLACQSLRKRESELAIAGGVNLILSPESSIFLCKAGAMSPTGQCRAFDQRADGMLRGEGSGAVVLKRLSDAQRDGDAILAVIRGSAVNHDGASGGITVPNPDAQTLLYRAALANAGVTPGDIDYVEAHGTGTKLGDPVELAGLAGVYAADRAQAKPLLVGSVKTNIGHTDSAAGVAGLIKTALILRHGEIPPSLNFNEPNAAFSWDRHALRVADTLRPLPDSEHVSRAGVTSFGLSGVNAHVIVEAYPDSDKDRAAPAPLATETAQILPLSAGDPVALGELFTAYAAMLDVEDPPALASLCRRAALTRTHLDVRAAFVASSVADLRAQLFAASSDNEQHNDEALGGARPAIAFVFSGQGPQWWGMGRELFASDPAFRAKLEEIDALFTALAGWSLIAAMRADKNESRIDATEVAQPAMFAMQVCLADLWQRWGVSPTAVAGHSMGEVAAAHVAGALGLADAVKVIYHRGRVLESATDGGRMLAVSMPLADARALLENYTASVSIAAFNGPASVVMSGDSQALDEIQATLEQSGIFHRELRVRFASHCPQMDRHRAELRAALEGISPQPTHTDLISTVTGELADGRNFGPDYWANNIREPVLFATAMDTLIERGVNVFLEIDPHPILAGSMTNCLESNSGRGLALSSLHRDKREREALLETVALLYRNGFAFDFNTLHPQRDDVHIRLPNYPWQRRRYWLENTTAYSPAEPRGQLSPDLNLQHVSSPLSSRIFATSVNQHSPDYLAGHRVHDATVFPGAALIKLFAQAAHIASAQSDIALAQLTFTTPLVLTDATTRLQVIVDETDVPDCPRMSIFSQTEAGGAAAQWLLHASCLTQAGGFVPGTPLVVQSACAELTAHDVDDFYAATATMGLHYAGEFRAIRELWAGEHAAIARCGSTHATASSELYPPTLDGCLHAAMVLLSHGDDPCPWIPLTIERFAVPSGLPADLWVRCVRRQATGDAIADGIATVDIELFDADGVPCGRIDGLVLKRVRQLLPVEDELSRLAYASEWVPTPIARYRGAAAPPHTLIFGDAGGFGKHLAQHLGVQDGRCTLVGRGETYVHDPAGAWTLDPADHTQVGRLLTDLQQESGMPGDVFFLAGLDVDEPRDVAGASLVAAQTRLFGDFLGIFKALAAASGEASPRLWLVTRCAQPAADGDTLAGFAQAGLRGVANVIRAEHPEFDTVCIDLDAESGGDQSSLLAREVTADDNERLIAFRAGTRLASRLVAQPLPPATASESLASVLRTERFGVLDRLHLEREPRKAPHGREVEIAVQATGLNFRDILSALGLLADNLATMGISAPGELPFGFECAGVVTAVGDAVDEFVPGQNVIGGLVPGCLASHVTMPADFVVARPADLSPTDAATLPIVFVTANYALTALAGLRRGERVLIHAAAGGVGQAAVQIAQRIGAEIFATASESKWELLRSQGIEHIMDSRKLDFAHEIAVATNGAGVDVVLNCLTGEFLDRSIDSCAANGRFVEIGITGILDHDAMRARRPDLRYWTVNLLDAARANPGTVREMLNDILDGIGDGSLQPIAAETFAAADAEAAFRHMAQAKHRGKIVILQPDQEPATTASGFDPQASYLITGGLGALGLEVAHWLVARGARHVLLLGRKPPGPQALESLRRMREGGASVDTASVDISDDAALQACLADYAANNPPLRGVIHAATVIDDGVLIKQDAQRFRTVLNAKVAGAWNLHKLTADHELDFFVCFSSAVSVLGGPGQANYAAANAFLDAFSAWRRAQSLPGMTINWGPWADVGLAAELTRRDQDRWRQRGVTPISRDDGLAAFGRLLESDRAQVMIIPVDWTRYGQSVDGATSAPQLSRLIASGSEAPDSQANFVNELTSADSNDREALLVREIRAQIAKVLDLPADVSVGMQVRLFDFGLDSLMALELKNRLEALLGKRLQSTLVFDYPTLDALTEFLSGVIFGTATADEATAPETEDVDTVSEDLDVDELAALLADELGTEPR